jgi:hypothetical protein
MLDVELMDPSFGGLNFSVTGSMRTGIFVKEILDPAIPNGLSKSGSSNKLKTGQDRRVSVSLPLMGDVYFPQVIVSSL